MTREAARWLADPLLRVFDFLPPAPASAAFRPWAVGVRATRSARRLGGAWWGKGCYSGLVAASHLVVRLEGWKAEVGGLSGLGMSYTCGSVPSPCRSCT